MREGCKIVTTVYIEGVDGHELFMSTYTLT